MENINFGNYKLTWKNLVDLVGKLSTTNRHIKIYLSLNIDGWIPLPVVTYS